MRPARFQNLLIAAVNNDGQFEAAHTYADARITRSMYGIILKGPVSADVQIAARSALGDDYAQTEHIVTGEAHPPLATTDRQPMRNTTPDSLDGVERYLAARAVDMSPQEISGIHLHGARGKPPNAIPHGFTVYFHDGSVIFAYITARA